MIELPSTNGSTELLKHSFIETFGKNICQLVFGANILEMKAAIWIGLLVEHMRPKVVILNRNVLGPGP